MTERTVGRPWASREHRYIEHRYIVTVPKNGYCFGADVRELRESDEDARAGAPARQLLGKRYSESTESTSSA